MDVFFLGKAERYWNGMAYQAETYSGFHSMKRL